MHAVFTTVLKPNACKKGKLLVKVKVINCEEKKVCFLVFVLSKELSFTRKSFLMRNRQTDNRVNRFERTLLFAQEKKLASRRK